MHARCKGHGSLISCWFGDFCRSGAVTVLDHPPKRNLKLLVVCRMLQVPYDRKTYNVEGNRLMLAAIICMVYWEIDSRRVDGPPDSLPAQLQILAACHERSWGQMGIGHWDGLL